jgi:hypothetical protein
LYSAQMRACFDAGADLPHNERPRQDLRQLRSSIHQHFQPTPTMEIRNPRRVLALGAPESGVLKGALPSCPQFSLLTLLQTSPAPRPPSSPTLPPASSTLGPSRPNTTQPRSQYGSTRFPPYPPGAPSSSSPRRAKSSPHWVLGYTASGSLLLRRMLTRSRRR